MQLVLQTYKICNLIPRAHIPLSGLADYRRGMSALDTRLRCTCIQCGDCMHTCMQCGDCNVCDDFPFTVNAVSSCRRRRHQKVAVKVYAAAVLALQIRQAFEQLPAVQKPV